jgi:hypothetical protein
MRSNQLESDVNVPQALLKRNTRVAHSFLRPTVFYAMEKVGVPHALGDTVYE